MLEEDDYYSYLEEIIKRDYFPDLVKLEAYNDYLAKQHQHPLHPATGTTARSGRSILVADRQTRGNAKLPSVLLKETPVDPGIFDKRDPIEKFLDKNRTKLQPLV